MTKSLPPPPSSPHATMLVSNPSRPVKDAMNRFSFPGELLGWSRTTVLKTIQRLKFNPQTWSTSPPSFPALKLARSEAGEFGACSRHRPHRHSRPLTITKEEEPLGPESSASEWGRTSSGTTLAPCDTGDGNRGKKVNHRGGGGGGGRGGSSRGQSHETRACYREMLRDDPHNPLLLRNYGKFLHEVEGDVAAAEDFYGRAILTTPGDGEILSLYGNLVWEAHGDKERAEDYFRRAVQASPDDCYVLGSYAHFLWETEVEEEEEEANAPVAVENQF